MWIGALRLLPRFVKSGVRSVQLALCLGLVVQAHPVTAQETSQQLRIVAAEFAQPTTRYPHGVLGDDVEFGALVLHLEDGRRITRQLPDNLVFEDVAPRLADVDGDGLPEVVVVESDQRLGARLAVHSADRRLVATPHIGRRFRWLAPIGIADLDGDGSIELAYVDRPHLAKTLRVWRFQNGSLTEIAALKGVTNHRIGERDIAGGLRDCGEGPEMIVASADWRSVLSVGLENGALRARKIGPHQNRSSFKSAMAC